MSKFKSFIKKNGKKIAIGVGLVALAGTAGYFGYKTICLNDSMDELKDTLKNISDDNKVLKDLNMKLAWDHDIIAEDNKRLLLDRNTLMMAASEGLYDEAIATVTRKLNRVKDAIECFEKQKIKNPNDSSIADKLAEYYTKSEMFELRINNFKTAQQTYELNFED